MYIYFILSSIHDPGFNQLNHEQIMQHSTRLSRTSLMFKRVVQNWRMNLHPLTDWTCTVDFKPFHFRRVSRSTNQAVVISACDRRSKTSCHGCYFQYPPQWNWQKNWATMGMVDGFFFRLTHSMFDFDPKLIWIFNERISTWEVFHRPSWLMIGLHRLGDSHHPWDFFP